MAYISKLQVLKKTKQIKDIAAKYGVKVTVKGANSSSLTVTVRSGTLDFVSDIVCSDNKVDIIKYGYYFDINVYWFQNMFTGKSRDFITEVYNVMLEDHYDLSDPMTDYFNIAWYNHIKIGTWEKPYVLVK